MKKLTLIFAAILALDSLTAKAQMRSGVDTLTLDQVKYRITYDAKQVNDTTQIPYIYRKAQMRLDIGSNITHFYNQSKEQWEQQVLQMMLSGGVIDLRKAEPVKCMDFEFLKNYPKNGQTLFQESWALRTYHCIEKAETPDWQLIPDSTTTIIGYHCQLAKTNFKGRTWYAWYAEDIPLPEGPWKLIGLPGLTLKAYDENKEYSFTAIGMSTLTAPTPITFPKAKREEISQKDLREFKKKFTPGMVLETLNIKNIKIQDEKGNPIDMKKFMNKKNVFNPIELQ
ncbi:MAG: GLPGLI family protein [Segatella copri]